LKKKKRFYLLSKVTLAVSKVRHLPHLPPLPYGHEISNRMYANSGTGTVYLSRALVFDKVSIVHFVFKLLVLCCNVRYHIHVKMMFPSSLLPFVS
jgi:hypothetical protein